MELLTLSEAVTFYEGECFCPVLFCERFESSFSLGVPAAISSFLVVLCLLYAARRTVVVDSSGGGFRGDGVSSGGLHDGATRKAVEEDNEDSKKDGE